MRSWWGAASRAALGVSMALASTVWEPQALPVLGNFAGKREYSTYSGLRWLKTKNLRWRWPAGQRAGLSRAGAGSHPLLQPHWVLPEPCNQVSEAWSAYL
jgi:hypothetical protein